MRPRTSPKAVSAPSPRVRRVDGFVLGKALHRGAMSTLYEVHDVDGRAPLAFPAVIKLPRTRAGEGGESLLGFETEVRILPALSGCGVPRFVAAGDIRQIPYLVLERVAGGNLERIARAAPLSPGRVADIGAAVADALHAIHGRGAIHLDVKPENVIIRPDGRAVLVDLGMAYHADFPDLLAEERRFASGSAPYISPEQVLGNRRDPRSDLYSLGVMLYELATGKLPFGIPRTLAGLRDRIWLDPAPPRLIAPAVPPWLQEITLRCLESSPDRRHSSAAELAAELRNPALVKLTERARKRERAGILAQARRWWEARAQPVARLAPAAPALGAPVVLVAVDTMHPEDPRHTVLRQETRRVLSLSTEYRLICVSVVRGEPVAPAANEPGIHYEHLVRLRDWVQSLRVPEERLSLHVIESLRPAQALLEFARNNKVDLIVIGAPSPGHQALAWWRSVASAVTANAQCSVHVVRVSAAVS